MDCSILLIGHGDLALSMKTSVEMITGNQNDLYALSMGEQATLDSFTKELSKKVDQLLQSYDELLILADIKGGTPCNAATKQLLEGKKVHLVSGFHLSLVIEACLTKSKPKELINNTLIGITYINEQI